MRNYLVAFLCLIAFSMNAQSPEKLKLFLDCEGGCDRQYIRQSIDYVDYVRDRQSSNVYMQLLQQGAGNGGDLYTFMFMGKGPFEGQNDTLLLTTGPNDTHVIRRDKQLAVIKKGILPYLVQTSTLDKITYNIESNDVEAVEEETFDPWNAWVFRLNANGNINGESSFKSFNFSSSFNANRITEESKFFMRVRLNRNNSEYKVGEEIYKNKNNSTNLFGLYALSLGPHWSAGAYGSFDNSDFSNTRYRISIKPAVEYSVFPYDEAATKEFIFQYRIGPNVNAYQEETIFDVMEETLIQQNFSINYRLLKDWGNVGFNLNFNNYLKDIELSSVSFGPNISWNVFKGFNINFSANASYISDRINIRKSNLTPEEILLGIRQLDTSFSYSSWFGVSYRFGSELNNVVNTRF